MPASSSEGFQREYKKIFGVIFPDYEIEIFNWTVEVATDVRISTLADHRYDKLRTAGRKIKGARSVFGSGGTSGTQSCPCMTVMRSRLGI